MSDFVQAELTAGDIAAMAHLAREQGAARERRRIRRAQRKALAMLREEVSVTTGNLWAWGVLDAATRSATRGKKR